MRRRRPWHRVVEDKKVREKEILREDDCLSWSCELLSHLILFLVWPIFLVIFTYSNVFFWPICKKGDANNSAHKHIDWMHGKMLFPFAPSITMCPSSFHVWLRTRKPLVLHACQSSCSPPPTWSQDVHPLLWIISIGSGGRRMLSSLLSLLRGVLMRVEEGVKPVFEWLYRQPPPPVASITAQLWISGSDTR